MKAIAITVAVASCCLWAGASSAQDEGQTPPAAVEASGQGGGEAALASVEPGQALGLAAAGALEAAVTTSLTFRSHTIGAFQQAGNLEGAGCPAPSTMISGACHPGYNDRVVIVNQYPNRGANTWRCGFKNNTTAQRTVWIYTLCGQ